MGAKQTTTLTKKKTSSQANQATTSTNAGSNKEQGSQSYSRDIYRAAFLAGYNHFQRLSIECKEPISWFWKGQIRVENETITSLLQEDNNGADHSTGTSNVTAAAGVTANDA